MDIGVKELRSPRPGRDNMVATRPRHYLRASIPCGGVTRTGFFSGMGMFIRLTAAVLFSTQVTQCLEVAARDIGRDRDPGAIAAIVIHSVGGPACIANTVQFRPIPSRPDDAEFWGRVLKNSPAADAHYVIGRAGTVVQVIPETQIAHHAAIANAVSIGIELVNRGDGVDPFPESQMIRLIDLIREIRRRHRAIAIENIVTHGDIDRRLCRCAGKEYRRRVDPGANFPLARVPKEVRFPADAFGGSTSLPQIAGSAPRRACATASH